MFAKEYKLLNIAQEIELYTKQFFTYKQFNYFLLLLTIY